MLRWCGWKERTELPGGWSFKSSKRLRGFGWKGRQDISSGGSFKGRRMLRGRAKGEVCADGVGCHRVPGHQGRDGEGDVCRGEAEAPSRGGD